MKIDREYFWPTTLAWIVAKISAFASNSNPTTPNFYATAVVDPSPCSI
jgi:hypothetical protein